MGVPFKQRQQYIDQANDAGIPPLLLDWRLKMGFPIQHIAATGIVNGKYVYGKFDQSVRTLEKPEKTPFEHNYPPRHTPDHTPASPKIKVTVKRSKLPKKTT